MSLEGDVVTESIGEEYNVPITQALNGRALPTDVDLRAYISVDSDRNNIYALYSGEWSTGPSSSLGRYIHIFDWDLNLKKVYKLDHLAINVHVDENGNLYTIEYEPENSIRIISDL